MDMNGAGGFNPYGGGFSASGFDDIFDMFSDASPHVLQVSVTILPLPPHLSQATTEI